METLAYLHFALTNETQAEAVPVLTGQIKELLEWFNWQIRSRHVRIYLLLLVVILSLVGTVGEALAQTLLRRGSSGIEVTEVQRRLQELGYFNQQPTGYFGEVTENSVRAFQGNLGLQIDGVVGPDTEAALFSGSVGQFQSQTLGTLPPPFAPSPPAYSDTSPVTFGEPIPTAIPLNELRPGDRGSDVVKLQEDLRREGFNPGQIDGIYGPQTQEAVRRFQGANSLFPNDGIADSATLSALNRPIGITTTSTPTRKEKRYVVVVPVRNNNTLNEVRLAGFGDAKLAKVRRGGYVNAGAFRDRNSAESLSHQLRSRGLDARVEHLR
ncbi:MAG: peptidoglycan-binding protein [Coleofasciculaceae cyanobacterium]